MFSKIRFWIPLALTITLLCGLIYGVGQQIYRTSVNDPQIQLSEEIAKGLSNGQDAQQLKSTPIDIAQSLTPFIIVYDQTAKPLIATGQLDGRIPSIPPGVLEYARIHGQNRITWQPKEGVRTAIIVTSYHGVKNAGFVLVGRSLRETEKREAQLMHLVLLGWIFTLVGSLVATIFFAGKSPKK